jgi:hypothetical protein
MRIGFWQFTSNENSTAAPNQRLPESLSGAVIMVGDMLGFFV